LRPGAAGRRVIIADALALLVDGHPHGPRQGSTLGLCDPFAAEKFATRERLGLKVGHRCRRSELCVRFFPRNAEHDKRAHKHRYKMAHGPSAPESDRNFSRNRGKRHRPSGLERSQPAAASSVRTSSAETFRGAVIAIAAISCATKSVLARSKPTSTSRCGT